ncbi:MAG: cellulase family glycosylhydrolase [Luteolibacter sp.]
MKLITPMIVALALAATASEPVVESKTAHPAAGLSLISNGDFSLATKDPKSPDEWNWDKDSPISWEEENGKHYLRLMSQKPGQLVQLTRAIPLTPDFKGLELSASFRIANFKFGSSFAKDIRLAYRFLDGGGTPISKAGGGFVLDSHAKDWTDIQRKFMVPQGAASIEVIPTINQVASGTLELQEIRLVPLSKVEAEAMITDAAAVVALKEGIAATTAKKKADDAVEVQKLLALPSKTVEIKVSGNKLVTTDGKVVFLQGVNVPSLEWSENGENILQSIKVALLDWKANAVRLPVHDGFWSGIGKALQSKPNDPETYRKIVDDAVAMAAGQGAYLILDLHRFGIPEERDVLFWKEAANRYKNNPAVLFDVFNEPGGISWEVWRNGGEWKWKLKKGETVAPSHPTVGMQALVNAVRATGAKNIIIAGGVGSAYDLSGILQGFALEDKTGNGIMYSTHFYNWHRNWQKSFLSVAEKYPIFVGEFGADIHKMSFVPAKNQEDPFTWMPDALGMIQKYGLNWTAFSLHPKATPVLIENWNYDPTPFFGVFVKDALGGKRFEMKNMR